MVVAAAAKRGTLEDRAGKHGEGHLLQLLPMPFTAESSELRDEEISLTDSSSLLHASHSPLRGLQVLVDTAVERAEAELFNAVSTSSWRPRMASGWRAKVI